MHQKSNNLPEPAHYSVEWLIGILSIVIVITFFPYLFEGRTFLPSDMIDTMTAPYNAEFKPPQAQNHCPFDGLVQTYPYKTATKEAIEKGKLTYWNPYILGGYPQYAETMGNNFDVFNILLLWFDADKVITLQTVIEFFLSGIGMIFLLRFFGVKPGVNLIFAIGYMLNSEFIASAEHRWIVASFCWVPFVIFMIIRFFYTHRPQNLFYTSGFLALTFLGGNFQTSFFTIFIVAVIILWYPDERYKLTRRLGMLAVIGFIGFSLSAFMWFPTLELLIQTIFHGGSLNSSSIYSSYSFFQRLLSLLLLGCFFFPGLPGDPQSFSIKKIAGLDIIDFNGAIGFLPVLFAVWGCFYLWKKKTVRPFILIAASGILLPILTPLYNILYHRFFIVSSFSFCIIGAVSFDQFINRIYRKDSFYRLMKWTKILFGILCGLLFILSTYITLNFQSLQTYLTRKIGPQILKPGFGKENLSWAIGRIEKTLQYYSFPSYALWLPIIAALLVIVVMMLYERNKLSQRVFLFIACFLTAVPLFIFARSWFPSLDTNAFPLYPQNRITSYLQSDSSGSRFMAWRDFSLDDPYILASNSSNIYKINDIHGYESLTNRSMIVFYLQRRLPDTLNLQLLGLFNVKYIIVGKRTVINPNLRFLYSADSLRIYENLLSKPRAYFAYKVILSANDSIAADVLVRQDFDGSAALFTQDDAPPKIASFSSEQGARTMHIDKSENEEVIITAKTEKKGIFVLTDTYYPGWKCYVNGTEQPIYRVNYCMRAILLDPGTSQIVFRFEPGIFTVGAGISGTALLCVLASFVFLYVKRSRTKIS
jgi:hypothetical protein